MHPILQRNNVRVFGTGTQPMLFAHGFGCDQNMWRFVAPAFAERYQVILFDYVGAGQADRRAYDPQRYATLHGYAQDVLDICAALDLHEVILVGHSVSSMIGLLAANQQPARFAHLIMVGPSPCYLNDPPTYHGGFEHADIVGLIDLMDKNYLGWAQLLAPTVMGNPDRPELAAELETSFCSTDPLTARQFAEATFLSDHRADLVHCAVPTLILQCTDDLIAPEAVGAYLHTQLANSTLRVMAATGHCPQMSHPAETIELMWAYLHASQTRT